jgi:hypothetical protein
MPVFRYSEKFPLRGRQKCQYSLRGRRLGLIIITHWHFPPLPRGAPRGCPARYAAGTNANGLRRVHALLSEPVVAGRRKAYGWSYGRNVALCRGSSRGFQAEKSEKANKINYGGRGVFEDQSYRSYRTIIKM